MTDNRYDAVIIGGGVIGSAIARELSRYDLHTCLLEKTEDVCSGTSKANSAIVHAGYDAKPGSKKAELNVKGNQMMGDLARDLEFEFKRPQATMPYASPSSFLVSTFSGRVILPVASTDTFA